MSRPSQNQALCGPGCVSRDRTQVTSPSAPSSHRLHRLEGLGRVAQVLEVAAEHARRLDRLEHPARLLGRAAERLGAQDGLACRGDGLDRLLVEVVGQGRRSRRRSRDGGSRPPGPWWPRGSPSGSRTPRPLRAARVHDPDPVPAALAVQRHRVEVADQPGAEHRDRVVLHVALAAARSGRRRARVGRPILGRAGAGRSPSGGQGGLGLGLGGLGLGGRRASASATGWSSAPITGTRETVSVRPTRSRLTSTTSSWRGSSSGWVENITTASVTGTNRVRFVSAARACDVGIRWRLPVTQYGPSSSVTRSSTVRTRFVGSPRRPSHLDQVELDPLDLQLLERDLVPVLEGAEGRVVEGHDLALVEQVAEATVLEVDGAPNHAVASPRHQLLAHAILQRRGPRLGRSRTRRAEHTLPALQPDRQAAHAPTGRA